MAHTSEVLMDQLPSFDLTCLPQSPRTSHLENDKDVTSHKVPRILPYAVPCNSLGHSFPGARNGGFANGFSYTPQGMMLSMISPKPIPEEIAASFTDPTTPDEVDFKVDKWNQEKEKVVMGPYNYLADSRGKEFRTLLQMSLNEWLEVPPEKSAIIANVVRMLHTSSLLIDDIQDNSELRRGRPVAHRIFGTALSINSANYVYFLALQELQKLNNPEAIEIFTTELLHLHRGQAMDLYWRDTLSCPTEAEYLEMVSNKTGGLFRLLYKLLRVESAAAIDLLPLIDLLGMLFQIADDYKNLCSKDYGQLKGVGEDLTEGKFSFPVVHSIRSDPTNSQLLHILRQRPTSDDVKRYAIDCMESTGSLMYAKELVGKMRLQAKELVDHIDQGSGKGKLLYALVDKITELT